MTTPQRLAGVFAAVLLNSGCANAQDESQPPIGRLGFMTGFGNGQATLSLSYQLAWQFGKNQKWQLGVGARLNQFFARDKIFKTAPARIVKGESGLGAFFKDPIEENIATVKFSSASVTALNVLIHASYVFSSKFAIGF